jgi:UPF0755 protein
MKNRKKLLIVFIPLGILFIAGIWLYTKIFSANTRFEEKSVLIYVPQAIEASAWIESPEGKKIVRHQSTFALTSSLKKFKTLKPGRYRIPRGINNNSLINMLRSGAQEPLTVRTDDVETIDALAGKLGKVMMYDSAQFMASFTNQQKLNSLGFNTYTLPAMLAPNTYEFFWTMTPDEYLKRMKDIYDNYWTADRLKQAERIGLSAEEVATLASIVKAETAKTEEAPKIAGLYLNRLKSGIALQSDPTAVFGKNSHASRVYLSDLQNDSPYNTYQRRGLPPGPINFPEKIFLEAVLGYEKHDFIFMCAQPKATGYHNFAKTLDQHNVYRKQYTTWLEDQGIR